ncbi:hypothetical protein SAMN02745121_03117 [Nannocystis exedens]|uniref:Uncharacterized protein n=1 Tax=Nannocystis exedens TaxID=54 RepID=A0A1I1Y6A8_9BACT|nr:hypothetical protein NAEX_04844 [Nannocystis exedens]SFE13673.1 hypothetical protein SAMN02745121_03117 [Nannocystis exedens]
MTPRDDRRRRRADAGRARRPASVCAGEYRQGRGGERTACGRQRLPRFIQFAASRRAGTIFGTFTRTTRRAGPQPSRRAGAACPPPPSRRAGDSPTLNRAGEQHDSTHPHRTEKQARLFVSTAPATSVIRPSHRADERARSPAPSNSLICRLPTGPETRRDSPPSDRAGEQARFSDRHRAGDHPRSVLSRRASDRPRLVAPAEPAARRDRSSVAVGRAGVARAGRRVASRDSPEYADPSGRRSSLARPPRRVMAMLAVYAACVDPPVRSAQRLRSPSLSTHLFLFPLFNNKWKSISRGPRRTLGGASLARRGAERASPPPAP